MFRFFVIQVMISNVLFLKLRLLSFFFFNNFVEQLGVFVKAIDVNSGIINFQVSEWVKTKLGGGG